MAGLVCGGARVPASPQQTRPRQPPVFRTTTELIEIDVVAVDKAGRPVHGLTKDDFILRDRKKPQVVETFTEVRREFERATELSPLPPEVRVDVASNTSARAGRLVVMVLDDLHVWQRRTEAVKDIARTVVADLGPESSMALIQTGGEHGVEVTDDRSRLLSSIDKFKGRRPSRRPLEVCDPIATPRDVETATASNLESGCEIQELNANRGMIRALEDAARILGAGDKRRKAFILISENAAKDISGLFDGGEQIANIVSGGGLVAAAAYEYQLLNTMNAMRRGNVAMYAIDPRGEVSTQKLQEECFPPPPSFFADPCVGTGLIDWTAWVRQAQHGLEIVAEETGGFALVNTDDFTGGISRIISDLDNYYLLGFYPDDAKTKGYRKIEVEVMGRPDLTLRFRQGYQMGDAPTPEKDTGELARLISGALPTNDLPLRLHAVPMPAGASPGSAPGKEARVALALEITVPTASMTVGDSDRLLDDIRYGLYAVDLKGAKVREHTGSGAKIALRPRAGLAVLPDNVTYEIVSELRLPPGQYQLRASATSDKLAAGGSVYLSFEVPDFSKPGLMLTDLVLAYADGPHVPIARDIPSTPATRSLAARAAAAASTARAVPAAALAPPPNLLPFDPTLDRVFTRADTLRLYFKAVRRGATPLTATISALNAKGATVLTFDRNLGAGDQPTLDIQLPLAQLIPGAYRLQIRVTDGTATATREIGLAIR
jgi:VWFA-related protein